MRRQLLTLGAVALVALGLAACEPPPPCPEGRTYLSAQSWWQDDADGNGRPDFPQSLHKDVGGHLHVETCFPVNQRVDSTVDFTVRLSSHQGWTGKGDKLDIGLAPGGSSVARVDAPDMTCGPKPERCEGEVDISLDTDQLPSGLQSLRFRYLPANHPNGDRQFVSTEWPVWVREEPGRPFEVGSKGWYEGVQYANARFRGQVPSRLSDEACFDFYTKGDSVAHASVHLDAAFGKDNEGTTLFHSESEYRGPVCFDTSRFTNGWHLLSLRADSPRGDGGVLSGIHEMSVLIEN